MVAVTVGDIANEVKSVLKTRGIWRALTDSGIAGVIAGAEPKVWVVDTGVAAGTVGAGKCWVITEFDKANLASGTEKMAGVQPYAANP